jgi:hypothetical protein
MGQRWICDRKSSVTMGVQNSGYSWRWVVEAIEFKRCSRDEDIVNHIWRNYWLKKVPILLWLSLNEGLIINGLLVGHDGLVFKLPNTSQKDQSNHHCIVSWIVKVYNMCMETSNWEFHVEDQNNNTWVHFILGDNVYDFDIASSTTTNTSVFIFDRQPIDILPLIFWIFPFGSKIYFKIWRSLL